MKRTVIYALLAGSLLVGACQKNEIECPPQPIDNGGVITNPTLLNSFVRKYEAPVQNFTLNPAAGTAATITTAKGASITVPAGAFVQPDGTTPVTGPVQLAVREITKKAEMVLSAMPTMCNGIPLASGGQYYLRATQNNVRLRLKRGAAVRILAPPPANQFRSEMRQMRLFLGQTMAAGEVNWVTTSNTAGSLTVDSISVNNIYSMILTNDSLGWANIDRFLYLGTQIPVTTNIAVPAADVSPSNTMIFWVFNNFNSVVRGRVVAGQNTVTVATLPVGQSLTAVVIRLVNGQYYFGKQTAIVAMGQQYTPALRALSEADLLAEVQQL